MIAIESAACKGCLICVDACPKKILAQDKSQINLKGYNPIMCTDMQKCISCAICAIVCPDSVIRVEREAS